MDWSLLFPAADRVYRGSRISFYFLVLVAAAGTIRSLIHILAVDGGATSIAGLDIQVEGGNNIVAMFAQWGASQLILALIYWLVILRYRFLVPAMIVTVALEQALRIGAGLLKPVEVAAPPPGEYGSYILLPLALLFLFLSLRKQ
jgi:hypothetical protein